MASALFAVSLVCLLSGTSAQADDVNVTEPDRREETFVSAKVGGNVTLPCFYGKDSDQWLYWFKQIPGQNPKFVSSVYTFNTNGIFHGEFKDNPRFSLTTKDKWTLLNIKSVEPSDSATYLCMKPFYREAFMGSVSLHVWGSALDIQASLHRWTSESLQPGGSLNLSCQVPAEARNHPQAGNYICSVVSCAHGGNRSGLDFAEKAALALAVVLVAVLAVLACVIPKRCRGSNNEPRTGFPAPSTTHDEEPQNDGSIHYVALQKFDPRKSRRPRANNNNECVYSGINL